MIITRVHRGASLTRTAEHRRTRPPLVGLLTSTPPPTPRPAPRTAVALASVYRDKGRR